MKPAAIAKAKATKRMTALAGVRLPLPGHCRHREADLRAALAADLKPEGVAEMFWVNDIAGCAAAIEIIKAQIAAIRRRHITWALNAYREGEHRRKAARVPWESQFSEEEWAWLEYFAEHDFQAEYRKSFLDHPLFSLLLTRIDKADQEVLRVLQSFLHDETKERDRLINQFDRRRRNAAHDKIAQAEELRRQEMFRMLMAKRTADLRSLGDSSGRVTALSGSSAENASRTIELPQVGSDAAAVVDELFVQTPSAAAKGAEYP